MKQKDKSVFIKELLDSLIILEKGIAELYDFPLAWQSISVQLYKILCGPDALLTRVIDNPRFHPMENQIEPRLFLMADNFGTEFKDGAVFKTYVYDKHNQNISLDAWLDQIIIVSNGIEIIIKDIIEFPRHKEAAHSDNKVYNKIELMKQFSIIRMKGKKYSSYELMIGAIADYAVRTIHDMLRNI